MSYKQLAFDWHLFSRKSKSGDGMVETGVSPFVTAQITHSQILSRRLSLSETGKGVIEAEP